MAFSYPYNTKPRPTVEFESTHDADIGLLRHVGSSYKSQFILWKADLQNQSDSIESRSIQNKRPLIRKTHDRDQERYAKTYRTGVAFRRAAWKRQNP